MGDGVDLGMLADLPEPVKGTGRIVDRIARLSPDCLLYTSDAATKA